MVTCLAKLAYLADRPGLVACAHSSYIPSIHMLSSNNSPCLTPAHGAHGAHGAVCTGGAACLGVGTSANFQQQELSALSSASLSAECQTGGAAFTGKGLGAISPGSNSPRQVG